MADSNPSINVVLRYAVHGYTCRPSTFGSGLRQPYMHRRSTALVAPPVSMTAAIRRVHHRTLCQNGSSTSSSTAMREKPALKRPSRGAASLSA